MNPGRLSPGIFLPNLNHRLTDGYFLNLVASKKNNS